MHTHVQGDRAGLGPVAPRGDYDGVTAADAFLDHEVELTQQPGFDHGTGEPVRPVAAVVLGRGQ